MVVGQHCAEAIDVFPDPFVIRMKDMRSVYMHHDAIGMAFGVGVASNMLTRVVDRRCNACFCKLAGNNCTRKAGSNNGDRAAHWDA